MSKVCTKGICQANRAVGGHLSFACFVLVYTNCVACLPGFGCKAGSPHDDQEHVYGVWISAGSMHSSFMIPSGPGDLFLLRFLVLISNVVASSNYFNIQQSNKGHAEDCSGSRPVPLPCPF